MKSIKQLYYDRIPCPNDIEINVHNSYLPHYMGLYEAYLITEDLRRGDNKVVEDLRGIDTAMGELLSDQALVGEIATLTAETKGYLKFATQSLEHIASQPHYEMEDPRQAALEILGDRACKYCGGVVVDPETGKAYCGRQAPTEIV